MKKTLLDWWRSARPYLGHALVGVAIGCLFAVAVITIYAAATNVTGTLFWILTVWMLCLFVTAAIAGAAGSLLYMSPYERKEWHARHGVRPAHAR